MSLSKQQAFFLLLNVREAFYGGAAGGGKSAALLADALKFVDKPGYAALLARRTFPELEGADGLISLAHEWFGPTDAKWNEQKHRWTFPAGTTIQFGHVQEEQDKTNYQGQAYQFFGFDELTHFTESIYEYIGFTRGRRRTAMKELGIPVRVRSASNPGGIGHAWVKSRFIDAPKPGVVFIPAKLRDNPGLDAEDYEESFEGVNETLRAQLLEGDWGAFEGAAYTVRDEDHVLARFEIPDWWERFESMDYGISNPTAWLVHAVDDEQNLVSFGEHYQPALPSETAPIVHALRQNWRSDFCWGDPASLATRTGTIKFGEPETIQTLFADLGVPIARAKNDPRLGYTKMLELLKLDETRRFPSWHPRAGQAGAPGWFIVGQNCPQLLEQLRTAPVAPIEDRYAGEQVDLKWERRYGHAHAAARYGVASRFAAAERPADDGEKDPRVLRALKRLASLARQEEDELMEV